MRFSIDFLKIKFFLLLRKIYLHMKENREKIKMGIMDNMINRHKQPTNQGHICLPEAGDIVTQTMKSISFVPKTIPAGDSSQNPLNHLSVDWHHSKAMHFHFFHLMDYVTVKGEPGIAPTCLYTRVTAAWASRESRFVRPIVAIIYWQGF